MSDTELLLFKRGIRFSSGSFFRWKFTIFDQKVFSWPNSTTGEPLHLSTNFWFQIFCYFYLNLPQQVYSYIRKQFQINRICYWSLDLLCPIRWISKLNRLCRITSLYLKVGTCFKPVFLFFFQALENPETSSQPAHQVLVWGKKPLK